MYAITEVILEIWVRLGAPPIPKFHISPHLSGVLHPFMMTHSPRASEELNLLVCTKLGLKPNLSQVYKSYI